MKKPTIHGIKDKAATAKLPVMIWKGKKKLDLTNFDFDDLLFCPDRGSKSVPVPGDHRERP